MSSLRKQVAVNANKYQFTSLSGVKYTVQSDRLPIRGTQGTVIVMHQTGEMENFLREPFAVAVKIGTLDRFERGFLQLIARLPAEDDLRMLFPELIPGALVLDGKEQDPLSFMAMTFAGESLKSRANQYDDDEFKKILEKLNKAFGTLFSCGIWCKDFHAGNVCWDGINVKFIDWTPLSWDRCAGFGPLEDLHSMIELIMQPRQLELVLEEFPTFKLIGGPVLSDTESSEEEEAPEPEPKTPVKEKKRTRDEEVPPAPKKKKSESKKVVVAPVETVETLEDKIARIGEICSQVETNLSNHVTHVSQINMAPMVLGEAIATFAKDPEQGNVTWMAMRDAARDTQKQVAKVTNWWQNVIAFLFYVTNGCHVEFDVHTMDRVIKERFAMLWEICCDEPGPFNLYEEKCYKKVQRYCHSGEFVHWLNSVDGKPLWTVVRFYDAGIVKRDTLWSQIKKLPPIFLERATDKSPEDPDCKIVPRLTQQGESQVFSQLTQ